MAPDFVMGTINYHGDFLPVVNLRKIFLLPQRDLELSDQLILATTQKSKVALWVDAVNEIAELTDDEITKTDTILMDISYMDSLFKLRDGIVLIHELDKFLTAEHTAKLDAALLQRNS